MKTTSAVKSYIYIIVSLLLATSGVGAQELDDYLDHARDGNRVAQYNAGVCYKFGYGTPTDQIEAFRWFRLSAENGYSDAQTQIGIFYHDGYAGLEPNPAEAIAWHTKAATQGSALSQYLLARQYLDGDGTPCDYSAAFVWLDKAVAQNFAMANTLKGLCYLQGAGTPVDTTMGNRYVRRGADGFDSEAAALLEARFKAVRPGVGRNSENVYTPEEFVYESYTGGCYLGEIGRRGQRRGSGIYLWDSGTNYVGEWDDGECSGYGTTDYGTARHYGAYVSSLPDGNGILISAEGYALKELNGCTVYVGSFSKGVFEGTGTLYDSSGEVVYYGSFRDGRPIDVFPSEESYGGYRWEVQHYGGGESYEGETLDGVRNGLGIYRWDDGALWFGIWSNGARGGEGIYISADGRSVSGTWLGNELQ